MAEGCCRERDNNGRVVVAQDFQQSEIRLAELHWSAEERRAEAGKEENSQQVSKRRKGGRDGGREGGREECSTSASRDEFGGALTLHLRGSASEAQSSLPAIR